MMCAAPAFHSTQHWFLLVVVLGFIGTLYFTLHNLAIDTYVKNLALNFTQVVSSPCKFTIHYICNYMINLNLSITEINNIMQTFSSQEFWFTAITTFLYFTAFTAMLADFAITADNPDEQYWYDAQVAAGVSIQHLFHNRHRF